MNGSPVGWPRVPIEEVYLGLFDGPHATPKLADEGPIFLGIKNITEDGRLDFSEIRHISEREFPRWTKRVEPQPGDIVFTYEATLNRYAIIPSGFRGCLGRRTALIRPDPAKVNTRFLFYYFFSPEWRSTVARNMLSGSTVDRIPLSEFPRFEIALPPLDVQDQIAGTLSGYDDLIENNIRRIAIVEEMAQAIYREWFVNFHFPGHQQVEMVESELGPIPEGWEVLPIGEAVDTLGGGTPSTKKEEYWEDGDIAWFSPSDLTAAGTMFITDSERQINQLGLDKSSAKLFPAYSVMMTSRATIGVTAINTTRACTNQGFVTCVPNERLSALQILFWVRENLELITTLASGATFKEINKTTFRGLPIAVPDRAVSEQYREVVEPIGREIETLQRQVRLLEETRDILLPRLVSGDLDVSELSVEPDAAVA